MQNFLRHFAIYLHHCRLCYAHGTIDIATRLFDLNACLKSLLRDLTGAALEPV
jgi:hypothetical protein